MPVTAVEWLEHIPADGTTTASFAAGAAAAEASSEQSKARRQWEQAWKALTRGPRPHGCNEHGRPKPRRAPRRGLRSPPIPDLDALAERNNRNLSDLLQELRVAGLGVQVLFGFLLALPFTVRFATLDPTQQDLYKATS